MRGFTRLLIVAVSTVTLVLLAAIGAAAASGTLGSGKALTAVVNVVVPNAAQGVNTAAKSEKTADENNGDNGKHTGECHPPGLSKHHHKHGTPGHKNHPCGEDGDDSD